MKKLLVITAVTLASASAFATKARMSSLGNARHLTDVQTIFVNPADLTLMGTWASFETGATNAAKTPTSKPNAEPGFARANGDARWGFYLGHTGTASALRDSAAAGTFLSEENPINLFYAAKMAEISWGLGLNYSNSDQKGTIGKQSTTGLTAGMRMGAWDASLGFGITDTAEVPGGSKWKGKSAIDLRAGYAMDAWYFYGQYGMNGGKVESNAGATTADTDNSTIQVGFINSSKVDGGEFFWGAAYAMTKAEDKTASTKAETTNLPVVIGIEADAASWLVLRGSITQSVLLGSTKNSPGETQSLANNTTVAAGAGLKFNKFNLDATLAASNTSLRDTGTNTPAAATDGKINGGSLLANVGLTYNF